MSDATFPEQGDVEDIVNWLRDRSRIAVTYQGEQKREYARFLGSIATLPPQDKAIEWLSYIAQHRTEDSDLEALVFLASRSRDIKSEITELMREWKIAEKEALAQYNSLVGQGSNRSTRITISDVASCEGDLSSFWCGSNLTIDATMLRAVAWCQIPGFEHWWERLTRVTTEDILANCWGGIQGAFLLFAMCRSDSARKLLATPLRHLFELMVNVDYKVPLPTDRTDKAETMADNVACLSAIMFSEHQLQLASNREAEAIKSILREYNNGAWRTWPDDESPSIETTAMAMHALGVKQPLGWKHMLAGASSWLLDQQNPEGYWDEPGAPDPVYLTVLVMDALNLAAGSPFPPAFATPPSNKRVAIDPNAIEPSSQDCSSERGPITRKERVEAFITEFQKVTGVRITKTDIWKAAGYKSRTEFERWERNDLRATKSADQNINRVLGDIEIMKRYLEQHRK